MMKEIKALPRQLFNMFWFVLLSGVLLIGCSRSTLDDDLVKAKGYGTISELETWLGDPTAIKSFKELEQRNLPDGTTVTDADGNTLGHGEYAVSMQNGREIREYGHPDRNEVRFQVTAKNGTIENVAITRRVKMLD